MTDSASNDAIAASLFADSALIAEHATRTGGGYRWARAVRLDIGADGTLLAVTPDAAPDGLPRAAGPVLPGMPNLHSHAFQRAMAGRAERAGADMTGAEDRAGEDSFWTWRQTMYGFVQRLSPDDIQAIAAQLYIEMLKAGYTAVGEFHYLHHDRDGTPYADRAETSHRVVAAARDVGIGITLLPVLYGRGGFDDRPVGPAQRRFANDADGFRALLEAVRPTLAGDPNAALGIAPHSLRAVHPDALRVAYDGLTAIDASASVHIHIAEQTLEVEDCLAATGARSVEWLLTNMPVDHRWCAVHATHMTSSETVGLARSGAVAGLCPTTEANLGDGLFPAPDYLAAGGRFGIGSDSHISVSPVEELRWFEYGQRLGQRRRNRLLPPSTAVAAADGTRSVGAALWKAALMGGAQAMGRPIGRLAPGSRADLVVLDPGCMPLYGAAEDGLLDAMTFAGNENPVSDVMVGGRWVVEAGRHPREREVAARYRAALDGLAV